MTHNRTPVLKLPGTLPIEGGLPIIVNEKVIGAIGVSGMTSQQDGQMAKAGVDALPKILGQEARRAPDVVPVPTRRVRRQTYAVPQSALGSGVDDSELVIPGGHASLGCRSRDRSLTPKPCTP